MPGPEVVRDASNRFGVADPDRSGSRGCLCLRWSQSLGPRCDAGLRVQKMSVGLVGPTVGADKAQAEVMVTQASMGEANG